MATVHRRLLVVLAFLSVVCFSAPLVLAQDRDDDRDRRSVEAQNRAYDNGYRRGEDHGRDDARRNRSFDYARDRDYRNADDGYNRRYGDRDWYRDQYRRGFLAGYTSGYRAFAPRRDYDRDDYGYGRAVPRPYSQYQAYVSVGYNRGYNDGLGKGRDDLRHERRYDPDRQKWYRDADRGWTRLLGPRSEYAAAYRQGFLNGYRAGYYERRYGYR